MDSSDGKALKSDHTISRHDPHGGQCPPTGVSSSFESPLRIIPYKRSSQLKGVPQRRWEFSHGISTHSARRKDRQTGHSRGSQINPPPLWAPAIAFVWGDILAEFPCASEVASARLQYALPPPHMFFGSEDDTKLGLKIHNWIRIRSWCLSQVIFEFYHLSAGCWT